jgi:hypothetical protein
MVCVWSHPQIERYNVLLVSVRRSCAELVKGIKGLVVMSADLDQVGPGVTHLLSCTVVQDAAVDSCS